LIGTTKKSVQANVVMYSSALCPYCVMAERLLLKKGVQSIQKIRVDLEPERRLEMIEKTRRRTVPQIYIGETYVGGYEDLAALERAGRLDQLLASS
jgi:glutaredoxin 3